RWSDAAASCAPAPRGSRPAALSADGAPAAPWASARGRAAKLPQSQPLPTARHRLAPARLASELARGGLSPRRLPVKARSRRDICAPRVTAAFRLWLYRCRCHCHCRRRSPLPAARARVRARLVASLLAWVALTVSPEPGQVAVSPLRP